MPWTALELSTKPVPTHFQLWSKQIPLVRGCPAEHQYKWSRLKPELHKRDMVALVTHDQLPMRWCRLYLGLRSCLIQTFLCWFDVTLWNKDSRVGKGNSWNSCISFRENVLSRCNWRNRNWWSTSPGWFSVGNWRRLMPVP